MTGKISNSVYEQYIRLAADQMRLEFETRIEWHELHRLLKVSFPVEIYHTTAKNEMQFGYVERPVHQSRTYDKDRFEVCNHRYTALCDEAHGAAILNESKYGISMSGNELQLTLLRAPSSPEMQADNGTQRFCYAFYAWEGSFIDADVVRQGYELNVRPYVTKGSLESFQMVWTDHKNIILETMKPAQDGSGNLILRFYEAAGAAVAATVGLGFLVSCCHICDMLEHPLEEAEAADSCVKLSFRAFEIKTLCLELGILPDHK